MTTVTQMKCACPSCLCIVDLSKAIMQDDQPFCSDACAQGHPEGSGSGCGHTGCGCN
ncbi:MAG: metallothionein [Cyanobacteria bacterium J06641_5]